MAKHDPNEPDLHGGRVRVPRSRGAVSGILLIILGAWGVLVPLVGPYVDFGYTPDTAWSVTEGRFWLEILPGAVTALGGLMLLLAANRIVTVLGAWLAVAGGAWFVVGPTLRVLLHISSVGAPIHTTTLGSTLETLLLFTGLGALILFLGASTLGRLAVVSVRDVKAAQRRERANRDENDGNDRGRDTHARRDRSSQDGRDDARQDTHLDGGRAADTDRVAPSPGGTRSASSDEYTDDASAGNGAHTATPGADTGRTAQR